MNGFWEHLKLHQTETDTRKLHYKFKVYPHTHHFSQYLHKKNMMYLAITTKYVLETPFVLMQILSHEILCWRLPWHVLSQPENHIGVSNETTNGKKNDLYRLSYQPTEGDIHQHGVVEQKSLHEYSYQRQSTSCKKNAREIVIVQVVLVPS